MRKATKWGVILSVAVFKNSARYIFLSLDIILHDNINAAKTEWQRGYPDLWSHDTYSIEALTNCRLKSVLSM